MVPDIAIFESRKVSTEDQKRIEIFFDEETKKQKVLLEIAKSTVHLPISETSVKETSSLFSNLVKESVKDVPYGSLMTPTQLERTTSLFAPTYASSVAMTHPRAELETGISPCSSEVLEDAESVIS